MSYSALVERTQALVSKATRYPIDMLAEDASFEDDLGIDSVKLVEIFALVREEFAIGKEVTLKRDEVRTIGAVARLLEKLTAPSAPSVAERVDRPEPAPPPPVLAPPPPPPPAPPALAPSPAPLVVVSPAARAPVAPSAPVSTRARVTAANDARPAPLAGKVVLVTGSGRGLGRTIALSLAAEGATVVVNSFHSRDAGDATCADIVQAGGKAVHAWGSVANEAHVARIFDEIGHRFGRLDGLVANASDGFIGPFDALTPAHWEKGFKTNVVGLHLCAAAASRLMAGGGQIVTMSTVTSNRYLRDFTCQGVLKAAVESLTRYLAVELAPRGVRVNCISAGPVHGELLHRFPNAEARIDNWTALTPTGELTDPSEVARLAGFLIGGTLRSATGSVIAVDGGMSLSIDGDISAAEPPSGISLVG